MLNIVWNECDQVDLAQNEKLHNQQSEQLTTNYKKYELIDGTHTDGNMKRLAAKYGTKINDYWFCGFNLPDKLKKHILGCLYDLCNVVNFHHWFILSWPVLVYSFVSKARARFVSYFSSSSLGSTWRGYYL